MCQRALRCLHLGFLAAILLLPAIGHAFPLWQKAEAGMSVAQVKALYPDALDVADDPRNRNGYGFTTRLRIPGAVQIVGREFAVQFMFKDDQLGQVTLVSERPGPLTLQSGNDTTAYARLVDALRERYGRELSHGGAPGMPETTWVSGRTTIRANFFTGTLMVFYVASESGDAGKL